MLEVTRLIDLAFSSVTQNSALLKYNYINLKLIPNKIILRDLSKLSIKYQNLLRKLDFLETITAETIFGFLDVFS